ncbi:MAG: hypothetical protein GY870_13375 [archaeon]|nr:hypothetical protein [archaeon]
MNPTELIISVMDGEIPKRVPTFAVTIENRVIFEIMKRPRIHNGIILNNSFMKWLLDNFGTQLNGIFLNQISKGLERRVKAGVILGFDATWAIHEITWKIIDSSHLYKYSGSLFKIVEDGYGNYTYYYLEPAIHSRKEYEEWEHWPDPDKLAKKTYKFYKKMVDLYGDKTCICGQGAVYGVFESLMISVGFGRMAKWVRKEQDLVKDFVEKTEEIMMKSTNAMMDAGVKVILQTDDMGHKAGSLMNPARIDKFFGGTYERLTKLVHEREGKIIIHSCGDNTENFPNFIKWGFDAAHALENTSNVNIPEIKKKYGDKITLIGGVGVDYLLTERSTDEEVVEGVKDALRVLAPGGRYILSPVHSEAHVPSSKLKVMLDAVKKYGTYPIQL